MTPEATLYRIVDEHPYLDREDEYSGLTIEQAAIRVDDLTGVGADVILADWGEQCDNCNGTGQELVSVAHPERGYERCGDCGGDGKWPGPWQWTDDDTGREVTMRREVS